jgi:L-serine dehydratase
MGCASPRSASMRNTLREEDYFSIGGGFILRGNEAAAAPAGRLPSPYPFDSGDELLVRARDTGSRAL